MALNLSNGGQLQDLSALKDLSRLLNPISLQFDAYPVNDYAPPNLPHVARILEQQNNHDLGARATRPTNKHMDIEVVKRGGQKLSLKANLDEALQALYEDGCLVLKGATSVEPASPEHLASLDYVKRDIVLNEAVRTILFSARNDDFFITACFPVRSGRSERTGRDLEWQKMVSIKELVGAWCFHFGGDRDVSWIVQIDGSPRGTNSGQMVEVRANGGDIFICHHWLLRSEPYLEKQPIPDVHAVVVSYLGKGFSGRGKINHQVGDKIEELAGNDCSRSGDHIIWKREALLQ
jgi:hypothetical protein